jgi:hypothetical protein
MGITKGVSDNPQGFGCRNCWPDSADAAHEARRTLKRELELIDESHFRVMTLKCPACSQVFLSVFTETVDLADGEDPQYWITLPLAAAEAADLAGQGSTVTEASLNALGPGRRSLARDFPKGSEPCNYWRTGMNVGRHD